jgi:hypothetical protein
VRAADQRGNLRAQAQEAVELIQARGFTRYAVRHPGFTLQILALHYHLAIARQNAAVHSWSALEAAGDSRGAAEARAVEVLQGILARENTLPGNAPAHPPSPGAPAGAEAFLRERLAQQVTNYFNHYALGPPESLYPSRGGPISPARDLFA